MEAMEARLKAVEREQDGQRNSTTQILIAIEVLKTRVGFLAAGIGMASGVASSVIVALVSTWVKGG